MIKIAHVETMFPEKFGIPRQSGLIEECRGRIVFEPEYRTKDAFKGLEEYSHIWILWKFSKVERKNWSATVKPPRLGGNLRKGVFATRSPFRPNPIGLSSVKLEGIEYDERLGTVLYVSGVDMLDGTPVYDIKPYLPYVDSHPEAIGGFSDRVKDYQLVVDNEEMLYQCMPSDIAKCVVKMLEQDPRPSYINDSDRIYGVCYSTYNVRFRVKATHVEILKVEQIL